MGPQSMFSQRLSNNTTINKPSVKKIFLTDLYKQYKFIPRLLKKIKTRGL